MGRALRTMTTVRGPSGPTDVTGSTASSCPPQERYCVLRCLHLRLRVRALQEGTGDCIDLLITSSKGVRMHTDAVDFTAQLVSAGASFSCCAASTFPC